jgi:hypothetical protein
MSGGGMATGQTGMTGQTGRNTAGRNTGGASAQGANGFLGANNNPNNFLGRNTQGQQAVTTTNQNRQNFRGGQQRGLDQSLLNLLNGGAQNAGNTNNRTNTIRPRQKVNFEHPTLQTSVVVNDVKVRFEKLATRYPQLKQIELIPGEGGIVILRGEVASEGDSKLAESLVRLEPGVKSIQNELTFPTPYSAE